MSNDNQQVADTMRRLAELAQGTARPGRSRRTNLPPSADHALQVAVNHANVAGVPAAGRFPALKRAVLRLNQLTLVPQTVYNRAMIDVATQMSHQVEVTLREELAATRAELDDLRQRLDEHEQGARLGHADTDALARSAAASVSRLRFDLERLVIDLRRTGGVPESRTVTEVADDVTAQSERAYADFEARFRGSEAEIRQRLMPYLDYVLPLRSSGAAAVDIGPGRGEWLDLMREYDIPAYGIELNQFFVDDAKERGLDVRHGDGIQALAETNPESVAAVTAFQVVEHLSLDQLEEFVRVAFDSLRPGGVAIFETPNPTNIRVGATTFLRDPTHVRPLHPDLLTFLLEQAGFFGVEVRFLNPSPEFADEVVVPDVPGSLSFRKQLDDVRWALYGPQDFAVIGRKPPQTA